ncbi:MAG: undecaprenyl/decaprenyl-phosphate alpha-N-acetylglucosaminyl 1-phosphate transferase [Candidatus Doudnabacteria bacterium]|nr:undecaprenyl/decaprenyl-phosphate alpha-N-acetylglucosaminyl 1-phosphate transferase [Candidatus Doudnabacteria bacterium]
MALITTPLVRRLAFAIDCVDHPKGGRHIHTKETAFLGGLAVIVSMASVIALYVVWGNFNISVVPHRFMHGIAAGVLLLVVGGYLDDRYTLSAKFSFIFPALSAAVVVGSGVGIGIDTLTNPFGGVVSLSGMFWGIPLSAVFVWCWIMGMTYTTKLLDGLDGLAAGVSLIGGLVMFALSLTERIDQPVTATLAIVFVGALAGYLVYAFHPASIFLGEIGSTFLGFFLAILAVLTGAKIATAVLVMGIPILDVAWAVLRRLLRGRSPFSADREHLHFLLLDAGLSQRQVVYIFYILAAVFGFIAVFLQSTGKLIALGILLVVMVGLVGFMASVYKKRS